MIRLALVVLVAGSLPAQARPFSGTNGVSFELTLNENGAVLTNQFQTIYLGRDCDTLEPGFASGQWWEEGATTFVRVRTIIYEFPNQSPGIPGARCTR